jgi:predicted esterase
MNNLKRGMPTISLVMVGLWSIGAVISGCGVGQWRGQTQAPAPTLTLLPPTSASSPLPTLALEETSAKEFDINAFDAIHAPVKGDDNKYLILGRVPVSKPAADLPPELAVFLGRWEGYGYYPPVNKDRKVVLVIQEISRQEGTLVAWSGANLQYPDRVGVIHFRVVQGPSPSLEWQVLSPDGGREIDRFTYDHANGLHQGSSKYSAGNVSVTLDPFKLVHDQSFYVYKDYAQYLAGKRIFAKTYQNSDLQHYGQGYLLYLPDGYEADGQKSWPLIFFLHGYGDRGDNVLLLAKASPFMYIREKGALPFIIVAPLLSAYEGYSSFPEVYMDGVLASVKADYRVDPKRIYVTGLSMGGEAAWRFALHQPDTFAAVAPLSAYLNHSDPATMRSIKDIPVWAIHGADDTLIPLARAQQPVEALKAVGGNIQFTILDGHDHDVWTDTYSDPKFYDWLLQHQRP